MTGRPLCEAVHAREHARRQREEAGTHLLDGAEDGQAEVGLAGLLGVGAADHLGAVLDGLLGVERALFGAKRRR
jgi:hypothetical protein